MIVILLSHPENIQKETEFVNQILEQCPDVIFHLRKPDFTKEQVEEIITSIEPGFYKRIVIHQHFALADKFGLKGIHLKESDRNKGLRGENVISTSFHSQEEALNSGDNFEYFFCSPVFPSISKPGYEPSENWDLSLQKENFRKKAVALGGVDSSKKQLLLEKGFENIAVLGAVWNSDNPVTAFMQIVQAFDA